MNLIEILQKNDAFISCELQASYYRCDYVLPMVRLGLFPFSNKLCTCYVVGNNCGDCGLQHFS